MKNPEQPDQPEPAIGQLWELRQILAHEQKDYVARGTLLSRWESKHSFGGGWNTDHPSNDHFFDDWWSKERKDIIMTFIPKNAFTVEPGRHIHLHGKEFIFIGRVSDSCAPPSEIDDLTKIICEFLNKMP